MVNVCLEAFTKEKVCVKYVQEFEPLQGKTWIINKALHGLLTSGVRWHERLSNCLSDMGYEPFKIEPDTWLNDCGDHHEHITVHVDDLLIASKDPQSVVDALTKKHHFKLKGTSLIY